MVPRNYGRIINISSESAVIGPVGSHDYGAAKAGIVGFTRAVARELAPSGITVNAVLPGPVMTGRRRSYLQHWAPLHNMTAEEATANFPGEAGIARYGEPEEIAELMAFLVSPGARWMTGSALRMDGGEVKSI